MAEDVRPADLTTEALHCLSLQETAHYYRNEPHDDRFSFELVRRAICAGDETAWTALVEIYGHQVVAWCRRAGAAEADCDDLAAVAWAKFWRSFGPPALARAHSTSAVLRYLMMCANCAVIDAARKRQLTVPLDEAHHHLLIEQTIGLLDCQCDAERSELWEWIATQVRSEAERVYLILAYEQDLKSREIHARRPDVFPAVEDVYRTRRALLDRLRRSDFLQRWYHSGPPEEAAVAGYGLALAASR